MAEGAGGPGWSDTVDMDSELLAGPGWSDMVYGGMAVDFAAFTGPVGSETVNVGTDVGLVVFTATGSAGAQEPEGI